MFSKTGNRTVHQNMTKVFFLVQIYEESVHKKKTNDTVTLQQLLKEFLFPQEEAFKVSAASFKAKFGLCKFCVTLINFRPMKGKKGLVPATTPTLAISKGCYQMTRALLLTLL